MIIMPTFFRKSAMRYRLSVLLLAGICVAGLKDVALGQNFPNNNNNNPLFGNNFNNVGGITIDSQGRRRGEGQR
jgi:hypothetical protein